MNTTHHESGRNDRDPLGLGRLPLAEPPADGWTEVRLALQAERRQRRVRVLGAWAVAASLVAAVVLAVILPPGGGTVPDVAGSPESATSATDAVPESVPVADLIELSQALELRLRRLRERTGSIPGEAALYIAEIEDTVARVDGALSAQPDSVALWSQRVNLMLDLELIYQHHWEREYGRMAAL